VAKIKYSHAAIEDLEQIGDYIATGLRNPIAALKTVNRIEDTVDKLADAPHIGTPLSARYEHVGDYRYLVCRDYLVFYHEESYEVHIDRILHGKRDYIAILFGELPEEEIE